MSDLDLELLYKSETGLESHLTLHCDDEDDDKFIRIHKNVNIYHNRQIPGYLVDKDMKIPTNDYLEWLKRRASK